MGTATCCETLPKLLIFSEGINDEAALFGCGKLGRINAEKGMPGQNRKKSLLIK
jgi:hypothetical protein